MLKKLVFIVLFTNIIALSLILIPIPQYIMYNNNNFCTFTCETIACTHKQHFLHFTKFFQLQILLLKSFPLNYEQSNILFYGVVCFIFMLYIIPKTKNWQIIMLIPFLLFTQFITTEKIFVSIVYLFILFSNYFGISLIDTYTLFFGYGWIIPLLLLINIIKSQFYRRTF